MANLLVRGCGLLVALAPAILMIVSILKPEHERTELFIVSMLGLAFFGIPGLYVAFKGLAKPSRRIEDLASGTSGAVWYALRSVRGCCLPLMRSVSWLDSLSFGTALSGSVQS